MNTTTTTTTTRAEAVMARIDRLIGGGAGWPTTTHAGTSADSLRVAGIKARIGRLLG